MTTYILPREYADAPSHGKFLTFILYAGITVEILLALRLVLKLFGANVTHSFTQFIYVLSYPLVSPFMDYLHSIKFNNAVMEISTLFTMTLYAACIWLLFEIFESYRETHPKEVIEHKPQVPNYFLQLKDALQK